MSWKVFNQNSYKSDLLSSESRRHCQAKRRNRMSFRRLCLPSCNARRLLYDNEYIEPDPNGYSYVYLMRHTISFGSEASNSRIMGERDRKLVNAHMLTMRDIQV